MIRYPEALRTAPALVAELRTSLTPEKKAKPEITAASTTPSAPLSMRTLSDGDALYALLVRKCEDVAHLIGTAPPGVPVYGSWEPLGVPANTSAEKAFSDATKLARFLEHQTHLAPIRWQFKIMGDVCKEVDRLMTRYPDDDPGVRLAAVCRGCGAERLTRYATRRYRGDEKFKCEACGLIHTSEEAAVQEFLWARKFKKGMISA